MSKKGFNKSKHSYGKQRKAKQDELAGVSYETQELFGDIKVKFGIDLTIGIDATTFFSDSKEVEGLIAKQIPKTIPISSDNKESVKSDKDTTDNKAVKTDKDITVEKTVKTDKDVTDKNKTTIKSDVDVTINVKTPEIAVTKLPETPLTEVSVVNMDTIDCGLKLLEENLNPLLLIMASDFKPGGGWLTGKTAQEEELFRRTTLAMSMAQPKIYRCYPIKGTGSIYSPDVLVFRDNRENNYDIYDWKDCAWLSFVAVPFIRNPKLVQNKVSKEWELNKEDESLTLNKIRMIFLIAKLQGHDSLVLGAGGNGAYNNPPQHSAKLFKQVIQEFNGVFKKITFAILTDENDKYGNCKIYKKILS